MNTIQNYEGFAVLSVSYEERMIRISWTIRPNGTYHTAHLYRHSDGSWHFDPVSEAYGPRLSQLIRTWLLAHPKPEKADEHMYRDVKGADDVSKTAYLLKQEEIYRRHFKEQIRREMRESGKIPYTKKA